MHLTENIYKTNCFIIAIIKQFVLYLPDFNSYPSYVSKLPHLF